MDFFQFTPDDCEMCGGENNFFSAKDDYHRESYVHSPIPCVCAPIPRRWIVHLTDATIWFLLVEWILRVVCYEPPPSARKLGREGLMQ